MFVTGMDFVPVLALLRKWLNVLVMVPSLGAWWRYRTTSDRDLFKPSWRLVHDQLCLWLAST